ncbi:MAG: hypothetical protein JO321_03760 [Solirubrobacterales bacterium]|nr:hypothetical protein [Solirubrobacterales bacterium]
MAPEQGPELDPWLPRPTVHVTHSRRSSASPDELWRAARTVLLRETALLGRLVQWRIPGTPAEIPYYELFRRAPFTVLEDGERSLVSGIVGRIWTLRRDYPTLAGAEEFRRFNSSGTARVVFAMWAADEPGGARLSAEVRVAAIGSQGRFGMAAVRPLIAAFQHLIGSDGLAAAVRKAESRSEQRPLGN